jgi:hypothetical protein
MKAGDSKVLVNPSRSTKLFNFRRITNTEYNKAYSIWD